ncbi:M50 family peptidase [Glutamicibacter soli]|uniref:M50 family peptidase n=1 Tax=Glutamicibacter soli TaxID=453836 RepID=A0A6L9G5H4_9MICC|nr:M50 family metallopeptidase [Glutamicibacter soli]NAZ16449.1 M50 family peptidase [Glutamicibacter soli]
MNLNIGEAWARLAEPVAVDLQAWQWATLAVVVGLLVLPRRIWRVTGLYSTLIHEMGHIVSAMLTGRFVMGLRLGWDHSGEVVSRGRGKFSVIFSGLFGYPAPLWVSAVMLWAISEGYAGRALGVYALFFLLALFFARNWPAVVVCLVTSAVALAVGFFAPAGTYVYLSLLIAGFLLLAGVKDFIKVIGVHTWRRRDLEQSDAYLIARATGTFATLWLVVMLALGAVALLWAVSSLVGLF